MKFKIPSHVLSRFDANEGVFLQRELENIDPTVYQELFRGLMAEKLIPRVANLAPLDKAYTYRMWSAQGKAEVTGPGSNDGNRITVTRKEVTVPIKDITTEYGWPVDDIKRAAAHNIPLEEQTIQAAMMFVARKIDNMLAFGEAGTDCKGLLNNSDIDDSSTPVTKTPSGTAWTATSKPSELLADLKIVINDTRAALLQAATWNAQTPAFDRWVIAVPSYHYGLLDTPRSDNSDTTILDMAKRSPFVEDIVEWNLLDTADGGSPMIIAFPRNPLCLGGLIAREWEQRPPQLEGHDVIVPAIASCGGTVVRYPVACRILKSV